jgi:hypothetical protein
LGEVRTRALALVGRVVVDCIILAWWSLLPFFAAMLFLLCFEMNARL